MRNPLSAGRNAYRSRRTADPAADATGNGGLLSEEEFDQLTATVNDKVREICQDLADGNIDIAPMKTKQRSACTYCQYRGICRFDTMFEGCQYKIIR